ncbi:MAG: ATP-binding protein [Deltaproteobacteria bacterium]|nr:MAG: ATP-binding protein [Deltaproteobacteria bacterium]
MSASGNATESQLQLMADWKDPPVIPLSWHRQLNGELELVQQGKCCTAVIGPQGTGKSFALRRAMASAVASASDSSALWGGDLTSAFYIIAASATHPKDGLRLILPALRGWALTISDDRRMGEAAMVSNIVGQMQLRGVRMLIIDEAQMMDPDPLDQVRLIYDECVSRGHEAGIVFVGTPGLEDRIAATGTLGQRVPRVVRSTLLDFPWVESHSPKLHPLMPQIAEELGTRRWKDLIQRRTTASGGKIRRLVEVLRFANAMALKQKVPMAEVHIDLGVRLLATDSSRQ